MQFSRNNNDKNYQVAIVWNSSITMVYFQLLDTFSPDCITYQRFWRSHGWNFFHLILHCIKATKGQHTNITALNPGFISRMRGMNNWYGSDLLKPVGKIAIQSLPSIIAFNMLCCYFIKALTSKRCKLKLFLKLERLPFSHYYRTRHVRLTAIGWYRSISLVGLTSSKFTLTWPLMGCLQIFFQRLSKFRSETKIWFNQFGLTLIWLISFFSPSK